MPSQKQQQTQNAIWIVENWCVVKHTNREQRLDTCQEVMNGDMHERWRAYWETPSSHVGERNAKNDNNEEHCSKMELDACQEVENWCVVKHTNREQRLDACQEVMNGDIHEWWRAYWETPSSHVGERNAKNDNNKEHHGKVELDACREVENWCVVKHTNREQ